MTVERVSWVGTIGDIRLPAMQKLRSWELRARPALVRVDRPVSSLGPDVMGWAVAFMEPTQVLVIGRPSETSRWLEIVIHLDARQLAPAGVLEFVTWDQRNWMGKDCSTHDPTSGKERGGIRRLRTPSPPTEICGR